MRWIAIISIDDMTGRAARRAIIARMIVRAEEVQGRVHQARLLQAKIDWVGSIVRARATWAQSLVGFARLIFAIRQADFKSSSPASLEDAQNVARLRNLPTRNR